jgi:hypothetical protein
MKSDGLIVSLNESTAPLNERVLTKPHRNDRIRPMVTKEPVPAIIHKSSFT